MARASANILEQHVEKIVAGVCGAALIVAIVLYVMSSPLKSSDGLTPSDFAEKVGQTAEEVARRVATKQPPDPKLSDKPQTTLPKWFDECPECGLIAIAGISPKLESAAMWPAPLVDVEGTAAEDKHDLATLLAPEKPVVKAGRTALKMYEPRPFDNVIQSATRTGEPREMALHYVNIVSQIDLLEQGRVFRSARYGPGKYDLPIVAVHVQRRITQDANAPWEDVAIYRDYLPISLPDLEFTSENRLTSESQIVFDNFRRLVNRGSELIARAKLPDRASGDEVVYPEVPWIWYDPTVDEVDDTQPASGGGGGGVQLGTTGGRGGRVKRPNWEIRFTRWFKQAEFEMKSTSTRAPNLDLAAILLEACLGEEGVDDKLREKARAKWQELETLRSRAKLPPLRAADGARRPEKMMPIQASDVDVTPGKTYVYRIRYEILNHYVGQPGDLRNPQDARRLTMLSPWSVASAAVEIRSDLYYYVTGVDPKTRAALFTIFKNQGRQWNKEKAVRAVVGEAVGELKKSGPRRNVDFSTGTVVVDVLPDDGGTVILVDTADGRLYRRSVNGDKDDAKFAELSALKL